MFNINKFYKGKKVLITGNTGFLGSWLSNLLLNCCAKPIGYALQPNTNPNMFKATSLDHRYKTYFCDIRNLKQLRYVVTKSRPDIVFHLAAQPLVKTGYSRPLYTFETNVIGTANVLEAVKASESTKAIVVVTTDKVYQDSGDIKYTESAQLGGHDPYSASKAAVEIIAESYSMSVSKYRNCGLATARIGNCLGGGDWSDYRIVPDLIRNIFKKKPMNLRNPDSIRPWQHAIEPMYGLMLLGARLYEDSKNYSGPWNFGPRDNNYIKVRDLLKLFSKRLGQATYTMNYEPFHETKILKLDSSKALTKLGWEGKMSVDSMVDLAAEWYASFYKKRNMSHITNIQIVNYLSSL